MITVICCTNRKGAYSRLLAEHYSGLLQEHGETTSILDLSDLPPDFISSGLYDRNGKPEKFVEIQGVIDRSEKFVFIIPEYNGSFPGVLKAFIDGLQFPTSFRGKVAALVGLSSGTQGGALAMSHLTDILNYLGMYVLPLKARLSNIEVGFENDKLTKTLYRDLLVMQMELLTKFGGNK
ncbi:MAG: NAD(P)H-dependent oxidoreductase [Bacteroidota bacterium]|nr:NAD(P)H-dependent oxidoreductase [Bacteroidota bacterium]